MNMSNIEQQNLSPREKFIVSARKQRILSNKCTNCGHSMLVTVNYCEKCFSRKFQSVELEGKGRVITYTIQAVAPEGFDDVGSYAWVVFEVDGVEFKLSGFLPGISSSSDLPLGSRVGISDYDQKHGLVLNKI